MRSECLGNGEDTTTCGDGSIYNGDRQNHVMRIMGNGLPGGQGNAGNAANIGIARLKTAGDARQFGSWHPEVCQFLLEDGSVRPVSANTAQDILRNLAVRNDGLPTGDF